MSSDNSPICNVKIDGAQIVRNIHATHDSLRVAMTENQSIEIDCAGVTEFDLSLIQLLLAAKRSADSSGKSLSLTAPASDALRAALERAGFLAPELAEADGTAAFWLKGSLAS